MHVIFINYHYDPGMSSAEALLNRYFTLVGWAEGLRMANADVTVIQRFSSDTRLDRKGARYWFVADGHAPGLRTWQMPVRMHRLARTLTAQCLSEGQKVAVHVNGLGYPLQVGLLRAMLPGPCAIVVQHHAGGPWSGWRRTCQRRGLGRVDGFFFTASALARPYLRAGVIRCSSKILQIVEGSTRFLPQARVDARAQTGLHGAPVLLWVGRLNQNKDPLTVLRGFRRLLNQVPEARLYMAYGSEDLLPRVQSYIQDHGSLRKAVELLGWIPHGELVPYYSSADYFVVGSHYEGSGYALLEAMACGVVPLVSDIPSFRMITDGGRVGALWPVGDQVALATEALALLGRPWEPLSAAVRRHFEQHLSFDAIGRQALMYYGELVAKRAGEAW